MTETAIDRRLLCQCRRWDDDHGCDYRATAEDALDRRLIAYLPPSQTKQTVHIRPPAASGGKHFVDYPFARALLELGA